MIPSYRVCREQEIHELWLSSWEIILSRNPPQQWLALSRRQRLPRRDFSGDFESPPVLEFQPYSSLCVLCIFFLVGLGLQNHKLNILHYRGLVMPFSPADSMTSGGLLFLHWREMVLWASYPVGMWDPSGRYPVGGPLLEYHSAFSLKWWIL